MMETAIQLKDKCSILLTKENNYTAVVFVSILSWSNFILYNKHLFTVHLQKEHIIPDFKELQSQLYNI